MVSTLTWKTQAVLRILTPPAKHARARYTVSSGEIKSKKTVPWVSLKKPSYTTHTETTALFDPTASRTLHSL
jgi:hypothetical protein